MKIAEETADANKSMQEARDTLQSLASNKDVLTFFLGVSIDYGDTLRAGEIQAELAENATNTAEQQRKLAEAQSQGSKELVGNSQAAIENRATVLGLVDSYQTQLEVMAANGASQAQLEAKSRELRNEFVNQATQAGFSAAQIDLYAQSFADMTLIIQKVPRKVTVDATANTSPALQALRELEAAASRSGQTAGGNVRRGIQSGLSGGGALSVAGLMAMQAVIRAQTGDNTFRVALGPGSGGGQVFGRANGGYAGDGGKYEPKGIYHGGEFIMTKEATSRIGVANLMAMMNNKSSMATSGAAVASSANRAQAGAAFTEMGANTMRVLNQIAASVGVTISADTIGKATSSANLKSNNLGAN
jgi:hypothetical protein